MTPRRRLLLILGLAASLILAGTVVWQVAWEAYHLRRLREDPARCRALVAVSESSSAGRAMRRFLRRPDGVKALLDTLSATVTPAAGRGAYPEILDAREVEERRRHVERWLRLVVRTGALERGAPQTVGPVEDDGQGNRVTVIDTESE